VEKKLQDNARREAVSSSHNPRLFGNCIIRLIPSMGRTRADFGNANAPRRRFIPLHLLSFLKPRKVNRRSTLWPGAICLLVGLRARSRIPETFL